MAEDQQTPNEGEQENPTYNVYVTGATSVAGLATIKALVANGHHVSALAGGSDAANALREVGALPVYGDPSDTGTVRGNLKMAEVDTIIHLMPQRYNLPPQIQQDFEAGATALRQETDALLDAAEAVGVSYVVLASYAWLYADSAEPVPADAPARSANGNAFFEAALHAEQRVLEMGGCVLRAGFLYDENLDGALGKLHRLLKRGLPVLVGRPGKLANWLRAEDLAPAVAAVVEARPAGAIFAVVGNEALSAHDFFTLFGEKLGLSVPPNLPGAVASALYGQTQVAIINTSVAVKNDRTKAELAWTPAYPDVDKSLEDILLTWRAGQRREIVPTT